MPFQIKALPPEPFQHLFALDEKALQETRARRVTVKAKPDVPCRISLQDADIGEAVILVNYRHQASDTPYRAEHAIYVRQNVQEAQLACGQVPRLFHHRLMSLRGFDANHMMEEVNAVMGIDLADAIAAMFDNNTIAYIHLHYAKPGCFAASAMRAG